MMESLLKRIENNRKAHSRWVALVLCLSMLVSLGTFAGFRQKAVAKTYTKEVLDCPYTHEGAEPVAHVHNDDCYDGEALVCALPEIEAHTHTEACFAEQRTLTCTLAENPGHQHGEGCYTAREENVCGLEENPGHVHNGTCFNDSGVLICTMAEGDGAHTHTADCFTTVYDLVCEIPEGEGAHTHTDECYSTERVMICDKQELPVHVHDAGCIRTEEITVDEPEETAAPEEKTIPEMPVSDPNADLETASDWEQDFEGLELSGNWARDLILVAATQQGRGESPNNFETILNDAGDAWVTHGYTRYGAWYGVPYAEEWSAMFVSFCLRYAGIPEENVPNNPTAAFMAESFSKGELFAGRDYVPAVGDLIFFDTVDDDITAIDHMGIVYHVDAEDGTINTVEGDRTNAVATFGYHLDDEQIVGYGILPQNPDYIPTEENLNDETAGLIVMTTEEQTAETSAPAVPMPAQSWERTAGGIKVSVEAPEGAFPENTKIAVTPVNGNSLKDTVSDAVSGEVLEVQAVDITFFDAEGHEIEPAVPIRVSMTPAATEHAEEKTNVVHVDVAQQTAELVEQAAGTEFDNSEVVFDADAFTIYAIVYTYQVEYEYEVDGKTFTSSMPGAENMSLTQIVKGLGIVDEAEIDTFVSKIASIVSSNEEVAIVTENNEIRVLKDGEAKIVITMQDGAKFHIDVRAEGETSASNETATVSTKGDLYLPADAELKAEVLDEVQSESAIAAVEAQEGNADSNATEAETAYQVFDISLENVEADQYNGFQVEVKIPEGIVGKNFRLYHVHDGKVDELELDNAAPDGEPVLLESVSFVTPSFSEFVLSYTVDFTYEGRTLHFPGDGSYLLTDILNAIGIYGTIDEATLTLVEGEYHEGALYLTLVDGAYYINSDIPFKDTYELLIRIGATVYTITVTDVSYNMSDAVSSVTADGLSGSDWTVKAGEEYTIHLSFEETPSVVQFPTTGNTLEYQLPNNFKPHGNLSNTPVTLTYTEASVTHTISGCTFSVDDNGKVTITLTDFAKEKLAESGDGKFNININGMFTETNEHTDFGGGNVKNITVDNTKDVTVNKEASYNSSDNKVHYTVTVKADGSLTNVKVSDVISGTALTMDQGSLTYSGNSSMPTGGANGAGFDMTFPSMNNGETITINYTASVNWNVIGEGKGTIEQTGNTVRVKPNETDEKTKEVNLENKISYNPLKKVAGETEETSDPDTKIKHWEIIVNEQGLKNMRNITIHDINQSPSFMKYAGDGITVEKYRFNNDGSTTLESSTPVSWDTLGVYDLDTATDWTYRITDDGVYKYVIKYTTEVDVTGQNGYTTIANSAEDNYGDNTGWVSDTVPPGSAAIGVDKVFGAATKDEMTWTVTMDIPATGLSKAILVDTLPSSGDYRDTLNVDSLHVEGLTGDESYVLSESRGKFTLTFYKDSEHTVPGLDATGRARQVVVTFKTDNDPLWVAEKREDEHTNNVYFQGDNSTVYDSDKGKIAQTGLEKNSTGYKTVTINGQEKIVFEYTIDLYGVTDADFADGGLVFTDDYDQNYVEFLDLSNSGDINGIDVYWAQKFRYSYGGEGGRNKIVPTDDGDKLTFKVQSTDLPMNGTEFFKAYQLKYYMVAKDSTALLQASLAKSDHLITINNKAKWDDSEDEVNIDYSYPGLVKTNVAPSSATDPNTLYNPETGTTGFKIVINPDKLQLNNGNPMTLEDVFSGNLSVDYASIRVIVEPAEGIGEQTVTYDYKGNVGTYIIPDSCRVTITYDARVIGNPGETVHYGNNVEMNGFTDSASGSAWMGGSGDGGFNIYSVQLFKYSAGHMERPLEGATFTLMDEQGNPVVYPDTAVDATKRGTPITFTTRSNGYVNISLNEQEDGISLQKGITYYLKETVSPATHAINNTTYRFTISDNPNYANYEYHSGDIVKVYDWPIQGRIEINKEIEGPENLTEEDKRKIKFEIIGTYDGTTPIKVDEWGYAIEQDDLSKYTAAELAAMDDFKVEITYADFTNGKYTMADLVDGVYSVKETAAALDSYNDVATVNTVYEVDTDGSRVDDNQTEGTTEAAITITDHSKYVINYKNTYTNKTHDFDLKIKKVNEDGTKALYGAVFSLEKLVGDKYELVKTGSVDADGTFTIGYDNRETGVMLFGLEEGTYRITEIQSPTNYKAVSDGVIIITVPSETSITDDDVLSYVVDQEQQSGTLTIKNETKHSYTVTKVDGANVSLKLPGAVFGVWESSYPSTVNVTDAMEADAGNSTEPLWTYTTDENGRFEIQKDDHEYEEGKIYFFKEITAPTGYELPENPAVNYFFFSIDGTAPTAMKPANLGTASRSQTITNELPNLEVTKLWKNLKGDNLNKQDIDVDYIDFVVYQKATEKKPDGTVVSEGAETRFPDDQTVYTIEYSSGNWTKVSIPNAPAMGMKGDNFIYYTYRVEELTPDGWVAAVAYSDSGREAAITNTPEPMEITVRKVWNVPASMDPNKDDAKAFFEVYQKNDSGSWVKIPIAGKDENELNRGNNWEMTFQVEAGSDYKIVETRSAPGHWPITSFDTTIIYNNESTSGRELEFSEAGDIEITNTYNEPYLEIRKVWETEDDINTLYPHVRVYRREIGTETWDTWQNDVTLEPGNNWAKSYKGSELPTDKQYEYYVEETSVVSSSNWQALNPNPYTVSYSASQDDPVQKTGSLIITNTKYDGEISVQKNWVYTDGSTAAKDGDTARVILQRALANKIGNNVVLNVTTYNYDHTYGTTDQHDPQIGNSIYQITVKDGTDVLFNLGSGSNLRSVSYSVNGDTKYSDTNLPSGNVEISNISSATNIDVQVICQYNGYSSTNARFVGTYKTDIEKTGSYEDVPGTAVILNSGNQWSHTWDNLPLNAGNNQEYVYSVREIQVNGKSLAAAGFISSVSGGDTQNGTVTVTNTELAKGSLKITKNVTIGKQPADKDTRADGTYTFRVTDSSGVKHTVSITIENGTANTAVLNDLPEGDATVQEISSTNTAVTMDLTPKTVNIVGGTTAENANVATVTITNDYDATGTVPFKAKKIYEDHTLEGEDFIFTLKEYTDPNFTTVKTGGVAQEKKNDANGDVLFDDVEYTVASAGTDAEHPKTFYYLIKETPDNNSSITYDATEYKVTVNVYDKGDGTLSVTKAVTPKVDVESASVTEGYDAQFVNKEKKTGALKLTKKVTVNGVDATADLKTAADGEYTFTVTGPGTDETIRYVQIKVEQGVASAYRIADTQSDLSTATYINGEWAIVPDLVEGDYVIAELPTTNGTTLTGITGGVTQSTSSDGDAPQTPAEGEQDGGDDAKQNSSSVTVHVTAGDTAAEEDEAQATFTNNIDVGYLKIHKEVTYNGVVPSTDAQKKALAGTYTFKIYTDENCTHAVMEGKNEKTLTVTIGEDGVANASAVIALPVGTYWIQEQTPEQTGVTPDGNPLEISITRNHTSENPGVVYFVNNREDSDNPDELAIELRKTFTGLTDSSEISSDFKVILTYNVLDSSDPVTVVLTGTTVGHVTCTKSTDGMTWQWHVTHIPSNATGFAVSESNYDITGYTRTTKINDNPVENPGNSQSVTVLVPTITMTNATSDYTTTDNNKVFTVADNQILLVRMTNHATVIVSQKSLGIAERTAIESMIHDNGGKIPETDGANAEWVENYVYFSHEIQGNSFSYGGRTIYFEGETVKVPHKSSSHEVRVDIGFTSESAENSFTLENDYEAKPITIEIEKVKKDATTVKLPGAVFTLRQIADQEPVSSGEYSSEEGTTTKTSEPTAEGTGKTSFTGLTSGYYELKEIKAPSGYVLTGETVTYFKISGGVLTWLEKGYGKPSTWQEKTSKGSGELTSFIAAAAADPENGVEAQNAVFVVENTPGTALPQTGGIGTTLFTALGGLMTATAGAILTMKSYRRRKQNA